MRILHVLNHMKDVGNGIVNVATDLAYSQCGTHDVAVASSGGAFATLVESNGGKHFHFDQRRTPANLARAAVRYVRIVREFRPDVVHVHMMTAMVFAKIFKPFFRYRIVSTVHNEFQRSAVLMILADRVVGNSVAVSNAMIRRGARREHVRTVLNGPIDSPRRAARDAYVPEVLRRPAIVSVGGLYERKGFDEVIAAFAELARTRPTIHLYIVGEGPDRPRFEAAAAASGCGERIHFVGFQRDPMPYMLGADIFVLASRKDPAPLAVSEARDAGCAIVASDVDGIPELLVRGVAGQLVPPRDPVALAAALAPLLDDPRELARWRARARAGAEMLSVARVVREMDEIYADAIARPDRAARDLVMTFDFPPSHGGIQQYVTQLWETGAPGKVVFVAPSVPGAAKADERIGARVVRVWRNRGVRKIGMYVGFAASILRFAARRNVVHLAHVGLSFSALPFARLLRGRLVVYTHALELTHRKTAPFTRRLLRVASRVVVVSEYTRALAVAAGAPPERIVKISPGGDDLCRTYPNASGEAFRARHAVAADTFVLLSVGRVSSSNRTKGFDRAIEVAEALRAREIAFRWFAVGSGDELEAMRRTVRERGLEASFEFLGGIGDADLADAYAASDVFCLFSREEQRDGIRLAEGYGIVYVQAASFGIPSVGLRAGGVPDSVVDGETGVLVERDDPTTLADAVAALLADPERRARLGEAGRARALGEASWGSARERMRELLISLERERVTGLRETRRSS